MPSFTRKSLFRRLPWVAILFALAGTYLLNRLGVLHGIEGWALDKELAASQQPSPDIVVVNINDDDYDNEFGGQSPLNPTKLHDLIDAISKSGPAVIAVDIDTSDLRFRKQFTVENAWRNRLIWERDVASGSITRDTPPAPVDVLGGQDPSLNLYSGIPELRDDPEDKVTRFYKRCIDTQAGLEPSFVYAVASAYRLLQDETSVKTPAVCPDDLKDPMQVFLIRFPLRPGSTVMVRDAAQVLGLAAEAKRAGGSAFPDFTGKIVLLGGTYRDYDRHYTPIGYLPGVMVLANAIETELHGPPQKASSRFVLFLVEFVCGAVVLVILSYVQSTMKVIVFGLALIVVIPLGFSLAWFQTPSRFAIFLPTVFAVVLVEIFEHTRHKYLVSAFGPQQKTHS